MVRKEDVVSWFKELESYKRIDAMCTLLNMCLPFELRFVGTFLEELGKRDFQELRGAELRANSVPELTADIGGGAASDPRTRLKMALYVSLLRSCNYACATTLYDVMVSMERSGLLNTLQGGMLEEILLLYTMALHHPAFTFDQKSHFGEILEKLRPEEKPVETEPSISSSECVLHPPNLSMPPPNLPPPPGLVYVKSPPSSLQSVASTSEQTPDLSSPNVSMPPATIPIMSDIHHPPPPPPGLPLPQYAEFIVGQPPWAATGLIVPALNPNIEVMNYPRVSSSPLVSSPSDSRPGSPHAPHRRASRDRVTPPTSSNTDSVTSLPNLIVNFDNLTVSEMRRLDDDRLRDMGVPPNVVTQLRSVEKLNGVLRRGAGATHGAGAARSSGSDSGSSGASSPPGTPAQPPHPMPSLPAPYSYLPYRGFPSYPGPPQFRPPPPAFANGEPYPPAPPYPGPGYLPMMYAPPKLSCWNCGASGHAGHDCKEPSMEEMTRAGGYQLDFGSAPPDPGEPK